MQRTTESSQISFELKDSQLKSIEQSRQSSNGKLTIKTAVRAGASTGFDCIYFARNAPFAPEHL
ncbi:hypothetical protein [Myxococcus sp. RHSTA-1-4]|uniref:hypothetical protein n=1 Tax=Myxococcus sp. RHSTA-1-4 TaxID=2874601 RepID=UPI001CBCA326|nr:hypothetical protein [Myxococcus sp. RHSTA-1-4]MBZ4418451.1 hypothetical protein [Myxococcus sp. RHSTA-1-4]